jgi:hypothetical protein
LYALLHTGAILHLAGQLATGSIDVLSTSFAYGGDNALALQNAGKSQYLGLVRTPKS